MNENRFWEAVIAISFLCGLALFIYFAHIENHIILKKSLDEQCEKLGYNKSTDFDFGNVLDDELDVECDGKVITNGWDVKCRTTTQCMKEDKWHKCLDYEPAVICYGMD